MILQALYEYYQRKQAHDAGALAPEGFEYKEIPFVISLHLDGTVATVRNTRSGDGKNRRARRFTVPKAVQRTVGISANLLWDNAEYTLGLACEGRSTTPDALARRLDAFKQRLRDDLSGCEDAGLKAVEAFLNQPSPASAIESFPEFAEIRATNPNLTFALIDGGGDLITDRKAVVDCLTVAQSARVAATSSDEAVNLVRCLVSGERGELARLHDAIKGVWGAQSSGANIVSFNLPAFTSYGKTQGGNAPVSRKVAEGYTAALNSLLGKDSKQRAQVGDASTVFWSSKSDSLAESAYAFLVGADTSVPDDPDVNTGPVGALYASIHNGKYVGSDADDRFYVLGLSPNAARLSVRFWHAAPVREFALHIHRYFEDIRIELPAYETRRFLPLYLLLRSIAVLGKLENIPPSVAGDTLRAIVDDLAFPAALLNMAVLRCRAERTVPPARASLLKACLLRQARARNTQEPDITMSLNSADPRPAYRLGRLFAALERIQGDALPGVKAGIRERYYGSASASPAAIFGLLLKNVQNHLGKLNDALATNHRKLLGEILSGLDGFPIQMPLAEQGLFAIGYYHQTQAFYTRKDIPATTTPASTENQAIA